MTRLPAVLLIVVLAACGGGGSGGGDYDTVQQIRDKLAAADLTCDGYEQNKEVMGAREDGSCKIGGDLATITIYNSSDQRAQIREAFSALASGIDVDGDKWTVNVPTNALATKVQKALGGKVK